MICNHFTIMTIQQRKDSHIDITVNKDVDYSSYDYFSDILFLHQSLPELNFNDIEIETKFFDKRISSPIIVNSMTGGTEYSFEINKKLAEFAEKNNIPLGLGSIRPVLEKRELFATFDIKKLAPTIPKFANIGMAQLIPYSKTFEKDLSTILDICDKLNVDGLAIHLNPLQEIVQPEGDEQFKGCVEGIKILRKETNLHLIIKETGGGINEFLAEKLDSIGIDYLDVNGSSGTSWSKVEYLRKGSKVKGFEEWGICTPFLIPTVKRRLKKAKLIAGGGIKDGIIAAKAIALGADYVSIAKSFIRALFSDNLQHYYDDMVKQLKVVMLLSASKDINELKKSKLLIKDKLKDLLEISKIDVSEFYFRGSKI